MSLESDTMSEVSELVEKLEDASHLSSRGKAYKRVYNIFNSDQKVVSWKFNEWDYGKNNIILPINARGLFILDSASPRIVTRGYDKFFNIDEVMTTRWEWLEENTVGPYEVTVKANGCIIFISALEDGTIVVCSKHSTGPRDDVDRNHALAGQKFLMDQLENMNIDPKEFAKDLYDNNITAVTEYCDDSFEEHILEYGNDKKGLYLHGLNLNQSKFQTLPMERVNRFGEKYGFKSIESFQKTNIHILRVFLEKCADEGSFHGNELEGFVIRCHLKENNNTFFFKYKFEEPYLMYRQWREVTKEYITNRTRIFRFKKHKFITNKYLDFAIPLLDKDPQLCEDYLNGFGIIKLRNLFLQSYGMTGMQILNHEKVKELELRNAIDYDKVDEHTKFLIFPIAVIGCGKTTTALTLKHLYKDTWGHIQNDDIRGKDKTMLIKKSLEKLSEPNIKCVFVDRNNHQYRERKQLFEWVDELKEEYLPYDTNVKIIGISFLSRDDIDTVKEITVKRVLERGDNHQTIRLNQYGEKKVIGIMSGFWKRFQPVDLNNYPDNAFDLMINLKVVDDNSSLSNTESIIKQIHKEYPVLIPTLPSKDELNNAFQEALSHQTKEIFKPVNGQTQKPKLKKLKPSFFSAVLRDKQNIIEKIKQSVADNQDKQTTINFGPLEKLFAGNMFQNEFHITLSHVVQGKKGDARAKRIWSTFMKHYENEMNVISASILERRQKGEKMNDEIRETFASGNEDHIDFRLSRLCWDDKIVSLLIELDRDYDKNSCVKNIEGKVINGLDCTNTVAHITVGIIQEGVKASYSNTLCRMILDQESDKTGLYSLEFNDSDIISADVNININ